MNQEVKKLWVDALRSGDYKQCKEQLRDENNKFCCLGVLCNLHAIAHPTIAAQQENKTEYIGQKALPSQLVYHWAGLPVNTCVTINGYIACLQNHNDDGRTFKQIAKAIEEQL